MSQSARRREDKRRRAALHNQKRDVSLSLRSGEARTELVKEAEKTLAELAFEMNKRRKK